MMVHDPDPCAVLEWVPFVDWVEGTVPLGGRRPTVDDLDYHPDHLVPAGARGAGSRSAT